jgi:hypothetical protein
MVECAWPLAPKPLSNSHDESAVSHALARVQLAREGRATRSRLIRQVSATRLRAFARNEAQDRGDWVHMLDTICTGGRPNRPLQLTNAPAIFA